MPIIVLCIAVDCYASQKHGDPSSTYCRTTIRQPTPLSWASTEVVGAAYISERSSSTKLKLNESTKRDAWLSLRDTSPWRITNSEECDVVWRNRYFGFLARLASLLLKPWCIMIEQGDTTRPAVDSFFPANRLPF